MHNILTVLLETVSFALLQLDSTDGSQFLLAYFGLIIFLYLFSYLLQAHLTQNSFLLQVVYFCILTYLASQSFSFDLSLLKVFKLDMEEKLPQYGLILPVTALFLIIYILAAYRQARRYYWILIEKGVIAYELFRPRVRSDLQKIINALLPEAPQLREISGKDLAIAAQLSRDLAQLPLLSKLGLKFSIFYIKISPFLFWGFPISFLYLSPEKQEKLLQRIEATKIVSVKLPLMILKLFVWQIYYEDPRAYKALGYRAESLGIFRKKIQWR